MSSEADSTGFSDRLVFDASMIGVDSCESISEVLRGLISEKELLLGARSESERMRYVWMLCRLDGSYTKLWEISERALEGLGREMGVEFPPPLELPVGAGYEEIIELSLAHLQCRQAAFNLHRELMMDQISESVPEPSEEDLAKLSGGLPLGE